MYNFDQVANPKLISISNLQLNNYNPNSNHKLGKEAKIIVDSTKSKFKEYFDYNNVEFVPGGGTIANKRAILGSVPYNPRRLDKYNFKDIILISPIEHKSINEVVVNELRNRKYTVIILKISSDGNILVNELINTIKQYENRIALISIMNVNNETGMVMGIRGIYKVVKAMNSSIIFHSDISQGVYKLNEQVDVVSFSLYKLGGPHIGIVLSKHELNEDYYGTIDVPSIQISGYVIDHYFDNIYGNNIMMAHIKDLLKDKINEVASKLNIEIKDISGDNSVPHIQSYLLPIGYEAKIIQNKLSDSNIFIGVGSACSSISDKGSHVIEALGYEKQVFSLIRFSYNEEISFNDISVNDINYMGNVLYDILKDLKPIVVVEGTSNKTKNKLVKVININRIYTNFPATLNIPENLESINPVYGAMKLSIGELYLKGKNRSVYEKMLIRSIIKFLKINKSDMLIKNGIYIVKNNKVSVSEYKTIAGIAKITPCVLIYRNSEDLYNLLSCVNGIIENELVLLNIVKFRITAKYTNINMYKDLAVNDFVINSGKYIIEKFRERVVVDLKNYDVNIQITIYNDIITINTVSYSGIGGLPIGVSGKGLIVNNKNNDIRNQLSVEMAKARGSYVDIIKEDSDIAKYDYLIMEPSNYNNTEIYHKLKELEIKHKKPAVTLTNLIMLDNEAKDNGEKNTKKVLMLLSGGIDSPVASYLLLKADYKVDFIHFTTEIDKIDNIIEIRNILNKESKIYVIDFRDIQNKIVKVSPEPYRTLMYKVFMVKIANKWGKGNYDYIATGNALGQVASQTIENITVTHLISELPNVVPLFGYNKNDIIKIAQEIGTFKPSTCDGTNDCCVMFMPTHPVTKGNYETVLKTIDKVDNECDNLKMTEY